MTQALAKVVQNTPEKGGSEDAQLPEWKWTPKRRKAVKMIARGRTIVSIAKEIKVHRNTVRNWRKHEEFHVAVLNELREYVNRTRYKRVAETGIIADQLAAQVAKRLDALNKKSEENGTLATPDQLELQSLQLFLREYREFRSQERSDFGDDVKRVEGTVSIIGMDTDALHARGDKGSQSFKKFVEEHAGKVPERIIQSATSPQSVLVEATRALVRDTDILDEIHAEEEGGKDAS